MEREVTIPEWGSVAAAKSGDGRALAGLYLDSPDLSAAVARANLRNRLRIRDGRDGLVVQARQHVGVVQLGPLRIRIRPKMQHSHLWSAVAYALGLDGIAAGDRAQFSITDSFADLLGRMLLLEAANLWREGLRHDYVTREAWLGSPRGRPLLAVLARHGPLDRAALPCRYNEFTADTLENQAVLAGLRLAGRLASDMRLVDALHRTAEVWSSVCSAVPVTRELLDRVDAGRHHLNAQYEGVHRLVRWLYERKDIDDTHASGLATSSGFLWDMARLFESFVVRFLKDHLPHEYEVLKQANLPHLYSAIRIPSSATRKSRWPPNPRPDIVLRREGHNVAVMDTKYIDLAEHRPSVGILYQMSVYSLAFGNLAERPIPAVVLYPFIGAASAPDEIIGLQIPAEPSPRRIILRGIDWEHAARLLQAGGAADAERRALAARWAGLAEAASLTS
jgi:5-methylcytosine-specific restriction enzyme subunit McrC